MDVAEFRPNATYLEGRVQVVFQYGRQERPAGMPAPAVGLNDSFFLFLAKCEAIAPQIVNGRFDGFAEVRLSS
jgi:hypothetical protein